LLISAFCFLNFGLFKNVDLLSDWRAGALRGAAGITSKRAVGPAVHGFLGVACAQGCIEDGQWEMGDGAAQIACNAVSSGTGRCSCRIKEHALVVLGGKVEVEGNDHKAESKKQRKEKRSDLYSWQSFQQSL
jgi:hypothetical protein